VDGRTSADFAVAVEAGPAAAAETGGAPSTMGLTSFFRIGSLPSEKASFGKACPYLVGHFLFSFGVEIGPPMVKHDSRHG